MKSVCPTDAVGTRGAGSSQPRLDYLRVSNNIQKEI